MTHIWKWEKKTFGEAEKSEFPGDACRKDVMRWAFSV